MCGIAGILRYGPGAEPLDPTPLGRMHDFMAHRGPDGAGLWYSADRKVGLSHRRLSFLDLSEAGAQPMASADGTTHITFNGEIYNYQALRRELEGKGFHFRSHSDTEVLLTLYADRGPAMVDALRGMFTFVIWDARQRTLFLARDPFGIKPLYYADDGATFVVASQVKAIEKSGLVGYAPEPAGHVGYFLWGHVPEPYTLNGNVRSLGAGISLAIDANGRKVERRFFNLAEELASAAQSRVEAGERQEYLRAALADSVEAHLIADVPVGVFLSAGRDSTTIAALASEIKGTELNAITLGFRDYRDTPQDETRLATEVAKHYGAAHHLEWITRSDFEAELERIQEHMDLPSIDGVNTYFVSRAARRAGVKATLSGLGGDEFFGGYPSFRQVPRIVAATGWMRALPGAGRTLRALAAPIAKRVTSPKYAGLFEYGPTVEGAYLLRRALYMPWEIPDLFDDGFAAEGLGRLETLARLRETTKGLEPLHPQVVALEASWYMRNQLLRDTDWASMAHSLEVRVPFVDIALFRKLAPLIMSGRPPSKDEMARAPRKALPVEIVDRPKTGFTTPVREWVMDCAAGEPTTRGLRGWAHMVFRQASKTSATPGYRAAPTAIVFRTGQLGDTLMALPAIDVLRKRLPGHRLVLLTDRQKQGSGYVSAWDLLEPTGWFAANVSYDPRVNGVGGLKEWGSLLLALRRMRADRFINLAAGRSRAQRMRDWFCFGLIARPRVYQPPVIERAPAKRNGVLPAMKPEWQYALEGVEATRAEIDAFAFPIASQTREQAIRRASAAGVDFMRPVLAVGPGSKMPAKVWPAERFAELGTRLIERHPQLQLVVVGAKQDAELGAGLCRAWGARSFNLAGEFTVEGSAAILAKCVGYVGNDTGTMHLAAMVGTPCAGIFSARDYPGRWDPFGFGHVVLRKDVPCAGCLLEVCEQYGNRCLKAIEVNEVFDAAEKLLREGRQCPQ